MNQDKYTTEYLKSLENLKLSVVSRERMEKELLEYARFHPVRVTTVSRFSNVPFGTSLFRNKFTTMPIAILIAIFISAGTSFAAQGATPGDLLYPIKTNVNESVASSLAVGADAQARFEAKVLEERLAEAEELKAEGRLTGDLAVSVSDNVAAQAGETLEAGAASKVEVKAETSARTQLALQKFIKLVGADSTLAAKANVQLNAISLASGDMDIKLLTSDISTRLNVLQKVVSDSSADLEADVEARFNAKLDSALDLTVDVANKTEAEIRESVNEAATLIGEVEAELSTLGQVEVNDNGMITDIDFSIDPMKLLNDEDDSTSTDGGDDSVSSDGSVDIDADVDVDVDTDPIDLNLNGAAGGGVQGSTGLGI